MSIHRDIELRRDLTRREKNLLHWLYQNDTGDRNDEDDNTDKTG